MRMSRPPLAAAQTKARKRLSVVSDNALIEGLEKTKLQETGPQLPPPPLEAGDTLITEYYGKSEKGYAPYNPRKANQDVYESVVDDATKSLLLLVMDGHGEFGHKVSAFLRNVFPQFLFGESTFATDVPTALREAMRKSEATMLKSNYQGGLGDQCEFSGTTFVATVIRGDMLWVSIILCPFFSFFLTYELRL